MKRFFYISEHLDELSAIEKELEQGGISSTQIHVLSQRDADVERHKLNQVEAVLKKDVVHSMQRGAIIGVIAAIAILTTVYLAGWASSTAGWLPFIFLSIVILGFCTWEGGLFGIQEPHHQFKQFQDALQQGKHVFFVDVHKHQEDKLKSVVQPYTQLIRAGEGESTPEWVIEWQNNWRGFVKSMP